MPIYETKNYEEVIARIQKKVVERNIELGECLSEEVQGIYHYGSGCSLA